MADRIACAAVVGHQLVSAMMYLSFCDLDKPKGTQFLGVCIVDADNIIAAVTLAHILGINPGGEVVGVEFHRPIPDKYMNVLMDKDAILAMDRDLLGKS